jgi:hypothetical protein
MKERPELITVGELIRQLSQYHDDFKVDFCGLDYNGLMRQGDRLVFVDFLQPVYRTRSGDVVVQNPE